MTLENHHAIISIRNREWGEEMNVVEMELNRVLERISTIDNITDSSLSKSDINKYVLQELQAMELSIYNALDLIKRTK